MSVLLPFVCSEPACSRTALFDGAGSWCREHADAGRPWAPPKPKPQPRRAPLPDTPVRVVLTEAPAGFARFLEEAGTDRAWERLP